MTPPVCGCTIESNWPHLQHCGANLFSMAVQAASIACPLRDKRSRDRSKTLLLFSRIPCSASYGGCWHGTTEPARGVDSSLECKKAPWRHSQAHMSSCNSSAALGNRHLAILTNHAREQSPISEPLAYSAWAKVGSHCHHIPLSWSNRTGVC